MNIKYFLQLILLTSLATSGCSQSTQKIPDIKNEDTQIRLINGNKRYIASQQTKSIKLTQRRAEIGKTQQPFAAILCCSHSRVPPEIIFDQGLGDIFVVRLAGNVLNHEALASLEYAAEHLGVKFIMVLGHERCEAVQAAVKGGPNHHGHIESLINAIRPAFDDARGESGDFLENSIRSNILMVVTQLSKSEPILKEIGILFKFQGIQVGVENLQPLQHTKINFLPLNLKRIQKLLSKEV